MKKSIILALSLATCSAFAQEKGIYTIKGRIDNYNEPAKIYLQYEENNEIVTLASPLKNGQFSFSGKIENPANGNLILSPSGVAPSPGEQYPQSLYFMLAAETIEINSPDVLPKATISGSKTNADLQELIDATGLVGAKIDSLRQEVAEASEELVNDNAYISAMQFRYESLQEEKQNVYVSFVKNKPESYISLMILESMSQQAENINRVDKLLQGLSPEIQNTNAGKALASRLNVSKFIAIGSVAPDFTLNDPDNRPIRLSDFRGKYLLIDFWASWCGPCRKENPNLVKAYQMYKDKNFEILGVSLDGPGNKIAWVQAIAKDHLTWPQVSDLGGWQSSVARQYNISSIPQNLLLDPEGVIIAKNLRGAAVTSKLAEIFK